MEKGDFFHFFWVYGNIEVRRNKDIQKGADMKKMNIPNMLTIFRFFLIPIFALFFFSDMENNLIYAFIVFFIAGVTDILDGYIARKFDLVTEIGKLLDPLADKFMLISVLICLTSTDLIPIWILIVIIIKELIMVFGAIYLYYSHVKIVIPSNRYGKNATVIFYLGICFVLLDLNVYLSKITLYFAVALALIAFVNYFKIAKHTKKHSKLE